MSATFEPRKVDKPFAQRWLRATVTLFLRSPIRFGILIALLGFLDTSVVNLAQGYVIEKAWADRLGSLALPFLWVVVAAVARGADDKRLTMDALKRLLRKPVWIGAMGAGLCLVALNWIVIFALQWVPTVLGLHKPSLFSPNQGQFLASIEASVLLMSIVVGLSYFPLLVLGPEVSPRDAALLSRRGNELNNSRLIIILVAVPVIIAAALATAMPAFGMTTAAFLVFVGVLNYVAYRDIFEHRDGNLLEQARQPQSSSIVAPAMSRPNAPKLPFSSSLQGAQTFSNEFAGWRIRI